MKKLLVFAVVAFAIMSFGTHIGMAHAQTASATSATPAQLQQELQVMKATLAKLEMEAGMIPQSDSGSSPSAAAGSATVTAAPAASAGLSAPDRATISSALGSLVSALASLNATLAANPQAIASHQAAIASVLGGMQSTLVAMNNAVQNGTVSGLTASAPIAAATPSTGSSPNNVTVTVTQPTTPAAPVIASNQPASQPSTGSLVPTAAPAGSNNQQQAAQASNAWGFVVSHWPTITIIILVALILLILFWPSKSDEREEQSSPRPAARPQAANRPLVASVAQNSQTGGTPAPTPVATIVSAQTTKVTVIRPQQNQQQQKKLA